MNRKLITLTSANRVDTETQKGIDIILHPLYVTHFHPAEQIEGNLTVVHLTDGKSILVSQSVEQVKELIEPTNESSSG